MIDTTLPNRDRLDDLLADRALFGLSHEEHAELEVLLALFPDADTDCFDRVAACVDLALGTDRFEPMPESLQATVRNQAADHLAKNQHRGQVEFPPAKASLPPGRRRFGYRESAAWILAAAAVAAAVLVWSYPGGSGEEAPSVAELREQMIREIDGLVRVNWQTTDDPTAARTTGDVVWNNARQQGFMRFRDLLKNDPGQYQYQLWIFDSDRDDRYPIDGGVFDIGVDRGETIVPIQAKLNVSRPIMFAVTVEKPGGVVVSSRERICLLAKLDG